MPDNKFSLAVSIMFTSNCNGSADTIWILSCHKQAGATIVYADMDMIYGYGLFRGAIFTLSSILILGELKYVSYANI